MKLDTLEQCSVSAPLVITVMAIGIPMMSQLLKDDESVGFYIHGHLCHMYIITVIQIIIASIKQEIIT